MNINSTVFIRGVNIYGSSPTLNGAATVIKRSVSATKTKNPTYVKHSKHLRKLNLKRGIWWGSGLMGFWALLVLMSTIEHLSSRSFPNATIRFKRTIAKNSIARFWRKHITMPALFNKNHTNRNMIGGALSTRFESIVISLYFVLVVIGESTNYSYYKNDTFWKEKKRATF